MGLRPLEIFSLLQCGDRLLSSEFAVCRRQILTTKVDPRAVRDKAVAAWLSISMWNFTKLVENWMKNQRNSSNLVDVKRGLILLSYQRMTVSITQADDLLYISYTLDLVIFVRFYLLRILREGQIREFKNIAKIVNPLTSRPGCMPGSSYTSVGVLFFVIWSWNC